MAKTTKSALPFVRFEGTVKERYAAGKALRDAGISVPEVAAVRTPARRVLQRRDRATADLRLSNLWARGSNAVNDRELHILVVLATCGFVALLLAFR